MGHFTILDLIILIIIGEVRFVAFLATEYDEVLSGYQLGQMVCSLLNHLTWLIAQENFIIIFGEVYKL
jgi:hypothetical protein